MQWDQGKAETFLNSIGKSIPQLYSLLEYTVPGKVYKAPTSNHKRNHSLTHYIKQLLSSVFTSKAKQFLSSMSMKSKRTLQSVYSEESLAILTNSADLDDALVQAQQYNIPLLQVVILTEEGEKVIKEKLLLSFTVAHLINENFVLYGDWEVRPELLSAVPGSQHLKSSMDVREGIYARKGQYVYAFLATWQINAAEQDTLEENLIKIRNLYYSIVNNQPNGFSHLSPPGGSDISASSSMFGPTHANQGGQRDNFSDSDEEWEDLPPQA